MVSKILLKLFFTGLFIVSSHCSNLLFSQQDTLYYRISFTDKNATNFSIANPAQFLSERAIQRRDKYNIPITQQDIPVCQNYVDSVLSFGSVKWKNQSKWLNTLVVTCDDTNDVNIIRNWSFIGGLSQTKVSKQEKSNKFDDLLIQDKESILVNPHFPYGITYNQNHLHKIDYLHDLGFKGQGIHIAIIDSGFEKANELEAMAITFSDNRILSTRDFVDHDGDVYADHYHGCAVLSVIAGEMEGEYHGTAPKASFHLLRTEDVSGEYILEEDYWVSAAEYADSIGADIINSSLGYTTFDDSTTNHTYSDLDGNTTVAAIGANIAASKGIFVCVSAGNSGDNSWGHISTPADADSILTVGAVDSLGIRVSFSSYGLSADGDIKPNVMSVGHNCYLIAPWDGTIIRANGTSFSSPMMAGMVASLWQALPDLNNMELKRIIQESSSQYNNPDSLMGYGIPNMYNAYQSETGLSYLVSTNLKIHNVYPNPLKNEETLTLMISSHIEQTIEITILDDLGRSIHSIGFNLYLGKNKIDISGIKQMSAGMYRLRILESDGDMSHIPLIVY
jgi:subtilisin family serine protease